MSRICKILMIFVILLLNPLYTYANIGKESDIKAAFIRDGNLWTIGNSKETAITQSGHVHHSAWSYDGKWLLYQKQAPSHFESNKTQNEIWVYNIETGEEKKIVDDGYNPQWSPNKNILTYQDKGVLNISDLHKFNNLALGISSYAWFPDGKTILLSSQANLKPDGWTNPALYIKKISDQVVHDNLFANVSEFFPIPNELEVNNKKVSFKLNGVDDMTFRGLTLLELSTDMRR